MTMKLLHILTLLLATLTIGTAAGIERELPPPDFYGRNADALGFTGGMDIPVINDFLVGYLAGAQAVKPDVKVAVSYVGSFSDAAKGKELGLAQYRAGVALSFVAAGQAGLGQLAAETRQ